MKNRKAQAGIVGVLALAGAGYGWQRYHTPEAFMERGQALQMQGRFKDAVPQYCEAVRRSPADPVSHSCYADALMRFSNIMVHHPATVHSPGMTAEAWNGPSRGQLPQVISEYSTAVQLDTQNVNYRVSLANALDLAGDTQAALVQWRKALALLPRTSSRVIGPHTQIDNAQALMGAYSCLAGDLAKTGAVAEADKDYQAALYWEPTYDYVRLDYANFLNQYGRRTEARVQWQKIVVQNHGEVPEARAMLAKYPEQI